MDKPLDEFRSLLAQSLNDEKDARDVYGDMSELIKQAEGLTDKEKSLIVGILFKIGTDEKTHKVLLSIIDAVVNAKDE